MYLFHIFSTDSLTTRLRTSALYRALEGGRPAEDLRSSEVFSGVSAQMGKTHGDSVGEDFKVLPPTHHLHVTVFAMLTDRELTVALGKFLRRLRKVVHFEYFVINEWSCEGHRHFHVLLREAAEVGSGVVGELWEKSLPKRTYFTHYWQAVRSAEAMAHYIVKNTAGGAEAVPETFRGRLWTYSRGFLSESLKSLLRGQRYIVRLRRT